MEPWIYFNRCDSTGRMAQGLCQDASAWTDLQHVVAGAQFRQRNNLAHNVGIDQKVLAESFVRRRKIGDRHKSAPAGKARRSLRQLFRQISQRCSEIVDEIGKLFYQVVGKGGSRLEGGKLLSLLLSDGLSD